MSDYKATLNLPQTDFPMKANLAQREPERLRAWAEMDLYGQMRKAAKGKTVNLHDMTSATANNFNQVSNEMHGAEVSKFGDLGNEKEVLR